jgi:hypothetical protein
MYVQPGYSSVTPCQTDNNRHIVRKEVTLHNGLATGSRVGVPTFSTERYVASPRAASSRTATGLAKGHQEPLLSS